MDTSPVHRRSIRIHTVAGPENTCIGTEDVNVETLAKLIEAFRGSKSKLESWHRAHERQRDHERGGGINRVEHGRAGRVKLTSKEQLDRVKTDVLRQKLLENCLHWEPMAEHSPRKHRLSTISKSTTSATPLFATTLLTSCTPCTIDTGRPQWNHNSDIFSSMYHLFVANDPTSQQPRINKPPTLLQLLRMPR